MVGAVGHPRTAVRPSTTVRDELRELTRHRLLAAAESVFESAGYTRTTIGNIAAAANVNRATFYLHFTDKVDILLAVREENLADTSQYWQEVDAALVDGGREPLRAALGKTLNWYEKHRRLLPTMREGMAIEPRLAEETDGTFAGFADEMSGYLARVAPDARDRAHLRLQLLMIQLNEMAFRVIVQRRRSIEREGLLDELTDMWLLVLPPARGSG